MSLYFYDLMITCSASDNIKSALPVKSFFRLLEFKINASNSN
uniref:Uncharacterized protein n=1 Tax=uncultured Desulfobacterium sp. TaxID=201089 RepID=E1Y8T0_9BACT|nr:unknown protein [uncultured Desulfobacterium sp.]